MELLFIVIAKWYHTFSYKFLHYYVTTTSDVSHIESNCIQKSLSPEVVPWKIALTSLPINGTIGLYHNIMLKSDLPFTKVSGSST